MEVQDSLFIRDFIIARHEWLSRMQRILTTAPPVDADLIEAICRSIAEQQRQLDSLTALLSQDGNN